MTPPASKANASSGEIVDNSNRSGILPICAIVALVAGGIGYSFGVIFNRDAASSAAPSSPAVGPATNGEAKKVVEKPKESETKVVKQAAAPPAKVEPAKPITFKSAFDEAKSSLEAIEGEDPTKVARRLSIEEKGNMQAALKSLREVGPTAVSPENVLRLYDYGLPKLIRKEYGLWAMKEEPFIFAANTIWDKTEAFRDSKSIENAAVIHGLYWRISGSVAMGHIPMKDKPSVAANRKSIDYWESFSGIRWDKLNN